VSSASTIALRNEHLVWELAGSEGVWRTTGFVNLQSGQRCAVAASDELGVVLSAAPAALCEPLLRLEQLRCTGLDMPSSTRLTLEFADAPAGLALWVNYELDGPTRRKWAVAENRGSCAVLLLDWELDDLQLDRLVAGGGLGQPLWLGDDAFAAVEHPSGQNRLESGRVRLGHCPGARLEAGARLVSQVALVSFSGRGQARRHFVDYVQQRCQRPARFVSLYTPFGINNQWGACPALDDEETLHTLALLGRWQRRGLRFDYFTLDTGWVDPASDLTRFRPNCYPNGPSQVIAAVQDLGMGLGLWFGTSWGTQSCWDYPPAFADNCPPGLSYRQGYPETLGGINFCLGWDPYYQLLERAVLHHMRQNHVSFLKFDGGMYACDDVSHGHLPGRYATEAMHQRLIGLAAKARELNPDVFIMWYWGLRSPFWALHGSTIFESGLHMEGSGTSAVPTLYYRDSVTLAQDQNAQYASSIPPLVKDSLGVWLADTRWGNFMGRERWRETLVMDLGRGNMLFPNLWGNLHHLDDGDVRWLAGLTRLARRHEALFAHRRQVGGDPWRNEPYGYAYGHGATALVFLNNAHFAARRVELELGPDLGLTARAGTELHLRTHFPEPAAVLPDGDRWQCGDRVELWLRPFEVLLLEVSRRAGPRPHRAPRRVTASQAEAAGQRLELEPRPVAPRLEVRFAEAARFAARGDQPQAAGWRVTLPSALPERPLLGLVVRLRRGDEEWRYSPTVVEIVQAVARCGGTALQFVPVPDGRQYGNTQHAGCSWLVYKVRLGQHLAGQQLDVAVHAWLPAEVQVHVEAWLVDRWWREEARPMPDGYYTYAPS
jgi:hypothetical protein